MNYEPMTRKTYWTKISQMLCNKTDRKFLWLWFTGNQTTRRFLAEEIQKLPNK